MNMKRLASLSLTLILCVSAHAAVFQYAVPVPSVTEKDKTVRTAYLWVPAGAAQIRGAIVSGQTLIELEFMIDPAIRQVCSEQQLALVYIYPTINFEVMADGGKQLQQALDDLAKVSGYQELSIAPLMSIGHSAGRSFAEHVPYWAPERSFGAIYFKCGAPGLPAYAGEKRLYNVPQLSVSGEFDEFGGPTRRANGHESWMSPRDSGMKFHALDERYLVSAIAEPGAGHFAWSQRIAAYVAKFIGKTAAARIPKSWPVDAKELNLIDIDPKSGWLVDPLFEPNPEVKPATEPTEQLTMVTVSTYPAPLLAKMKVPVIKHPVPAAPYAQYTGDKATAFWVSDEEMAAAYIAFHAGQFNKKDQVIKWNDPYWVDAGVRHMITALKWVGDGQTFELHPVYDSTFPDTYEATKGKPVGNSGGPILLKHTSGACVQVGPTTFRIKEDGFEGNRMVLMAYNVGDAEYRYTESNAIIKNKTTQTSGKAQTITFPAIGDIKANSSLVELKATSDSGLPVEYYVAYGPAVIEGNRLRISEIPARAQLPVAIKVVAWQFGSALEPLVKTADRVEQVINIVAP